MNNQNSASGMSIASLVLGIIGIVIGCCYPVVGLICSIVGLVLGIQGYKQSNTGLGIAGIVVSAIALLMDIIIWIIQAVFVGIFEALFTAIGLM